MQQEKNYKQILSEWFRQLDLRQGPDFKDAAEEAEMERRMETNLHDHIFLQPVYVRTLKFPMPLRGVAAALFLIGLGAWWFVLSRPNAENATVFYETATVAGERKVVTMIDGTKIFLNNTSKVKYAKNYSGKSRMVYLEGEAFFDVVHNRDKPFIVASGQLKIHVLGTSFNVKAYSYDPKIAVTVSTGRVGVVQKGKKQAWMLIPGDQLSYNKENGSALYSKVKADDYTGWTSGQLIFNNERMDTICSQLEKSYGVHFNIKNPDINSKRINLKINNENIGTIVKMLSLTGKFNYTIKDKEITINNI